MIPKEERTQNTKYLFFVAILCLNVKLYGYASTRGPEIIAEAEAFSSSHHGGLLHGEAVEGARRHLAATSVVVEGKAQGIGGSGGTRVNEGYP